MKQPRVALKQLIPEASVVQRSIQVALWNHFGQPKVDRLQDGLAIVHLCLDTDFTDLSILLGDVLDIDEFLQFVQMWTDNALEREYVKTPEYLLIRSSPNRQ